VSVWKVGTNPVIETLSLASVTLPPTAHQFAIQGDKCGSYNKKLQQQKSFPFSHFS
jgi:hypothetical protein